VEAAHLPWRPLGQLLVDEGLLTHAQLEEALDNQATTGRRLGEIAVEFRFISHMALSRVLSAQYGVELKSEAGFGAGLRRELERRADDESDPGAPRPDFLVAPLGLAPPLPTVAHDLLLADLERELEALRQTSEYGHEETARLSEALSDRDTELAALREAHDRRQGQAIKFAAAVRERERRLAAAQQELSELQGTAAHLRGSLEHTDREAELLAESLTERDSQLAELRTADERTRRQAAKFATRLRLRDAQLGQRESELADQRGAVAEARDEAAKLFELVGVRDRELAALGEELTDLRRATEDVHGEAGRLADALGVRDARLSERDEVISRLEAELAALRETAGHGEDEAGQLAEVLSARDGQLAARDRELAVLHEAYRHRHDQAARFARRARRGNDRSAELRSNRVGDVQRDDPRHDGGAVGYVVFAEFAHRYALVEREGVVPDPDATFELPDVDSGTLRVVRLGPSPLPNDARSCVFAERVHEPVPEPA
jgi:predicted nuclease with TOPRIM domain